MLMAFQLFLEPLPLSGYWLYMMVPLVVVIAVVYKTIKINDLSKLPQQAASLTLQILFYMVLGQATLWLLTEWVLADPWK